MLISEVFYSIQGEGVQQGRAAAFIRFFGCDLDCDFCDEPVHRTVQEKRTINQLIQQLALWPTTYVILTGGEPSLEDRNDLIDGLHAKGYEVAVETNGYDPSHIVQADWVTYSPKDWGNVDFQPFFDEIKLVCDSQSEAKLIKHIAEGTDKPVLLQAKHVKNPETTRLNADFCNQQILENPRLRLSLGLQRFLKFK